MITHKYWQKLAHNYWYVAHTRVWLWFSILFPVKACHVFHMHEDREKGRDSALGTEGGSSGMNSLLRELSLSLCLSVALSVTLHFTASCFSQIQWCLFEERHELKKKKERVRREIECEVKAGLRESFLHAWHLVGWGIGDVTCSGTSLKLRGHGEQITPPQCSWPLYLLYLRSCVSVRVLPFSDCDCNTLPSDVCLNYLTEVSP